MMKDHVSGHGTTLRVSGSPDHTRVASCKEGKVGEKGKPKGTQQSKRKSISLTKNKHKIQNFSQKRTLLGGPKDAKTRKDYHKALMALRRVVFRPHRPGKGADKDYTQNEGKGKSSKRKGKKESHPQSGLNHLKREKATTGNLMNCLPVNGLMTFGLKLQDDPAREIILLG